MRNVKCDMRNVKWDYTFLDDQYVKWELWNFAWNVNWIYGKMRSLFHLSRRKMQMQIMKLMPWMVFANLQKGFEGFRLLLWFSTALCDDQLQPSGAVEDNTIFIVNGQGWASMWTVFYTKLIIIRPNELRRGHWRLDEVSRRVVTLSISTPIVFVILSVL